jgi:hypothetical protein
VIEGTIGIDVDVNDDGIDAEADRRIPTENSWFVSYEQILWGGDLL